MTDTYILIWRKVLISNGKPLTNNIEYTHNWLCLAQAKSLSFTKIESNLKSKHRELIEIVSSWCFLFVVTEDCVNGKIRGQPGRDISIVMRD